MTDLKKYIPIAESIAKLLHPFAEVVLHDMKKNQITKIFNSFSQRRQGDDSCIDNIEALEKGPDINGPYIYDNFYGNCVKYITTVLRNDEGEAIGLLCINIDIKDFQIHRNKINHFLEKKTDSSDFDKLFDNDWQDRIRSFVQSFLKEKNRSLSKLTKQERMELVRSLHTAGGFRATNAANFTADVLGVSRATIYNYLNKAETTKAY